MFGGFLAAIGHGVTTDAGRFIQLTIWVATSLALGLTAHRLTGRLSLGVTSLATAFLLLNGLIAEPMHPGALIGALLAAMAAAIAFALPARPRPALATVGALAAALLLTKINVGAYVIVAIGFATVMAGTSLVRHALLRWLAVAAFVLIGPVVMANKLNTSWARSYALLAVLATLALVFVALPRDGDAAVRDESVDWLMWLVGGFIGCAVVVLVILFALGTTPSALVHLILVVPTRQASFLTEPITLQPNVIWWSLAATGLAWTWRQRMGADDGGNLSPSLADGLLRAVAGVAILLSLASESVFNIAPNAAFAFGMPFAWVAALPIPAAIATSRVRLGRLLIPALAILYCLLAYPVAGTQVVMGSILLVPCGAICVADGWAVLEGCGAVHAVGRVTARSALSAVAVALAVGTTFLYIIQPLAANHDQYRAQSPVDVGGVTRLHLPPSQSGPIDAVVGLVRSRCHSLLSLPGMWGFNIWTGLPTPTATVAAQPYWRELSYAQQTSMLRAAESTPGLCVVRNVTLEAQYGGVTLSSPIARYLVEAFRPIAQLPPYTVEVRR